MIVTKSLDLESMYNDLTTLESATGDFTSENLPSNVKTEVRKMMDGIYGMYHEIITILEPFYNIEDESSFTSDFYNKRQIFKEKYIDNTGHISPFRIRNLKMPCDNVNDALKDLAAAKGRGIGRELEDIVNSRKLWFQDDGRVNREFPQFFENINKGIFSVSSYSALNALLMNSKPTFMKMKNHISLRKVD
jgi:hypothetical protein